MTVADAFALGYRPYDQKYQRGYVSRVTWNESDAEVLTAGGNRKGELYFLAPAWETSNYCYRVYLRKER